MIDKHAEHLLKFLNNIVKDDSYKIIEIPTLLASYKRKENINESELNSIVAQLEQREYIDKKYSDKDVYCLRVLPKGKVHFEEESDLVKQIAKLKRSFVFYVLLSGVVAFLGATIAVLLFD